MQQIKLISGSVFNRLPPCFIHGSEIFPATFVPDPRVAMIFKSNET
jgi:hypothetical protein